MQPIRPRVVAWVVLAFLGSVILASSVRAAATPDPLTGIYYEHEAVGATWDSARVNAAGRTFGTKPGHLISITSERENLIARFLGGIGEKHIGLTDSTGISTIDGFNYQTTLGTTEGGDTSGSPLPAPGDVPVAGQRGFGFRWITGEPFTYQKWNSGEPSNLFGNSDGVRNGQAGTWINETIGATVGEIDSIRGFFIEYDTILTQQKFSIIERRPAATFNTGDVNNLTQAKSLLALPTGHVDIASQATAEGFVISFHDPDNGGGLGGIVRSPYLADVVGTDDQHFAYRATAQVVIPTAGDWTFGVTSGEVFELAIGGNVYTGEGTDAAGGLPRLTRPGVGGTLMAAAGGSGDSFYFPTPGIYDLVLTTFESQSAAFVQLLAAPGNQTTFDAALFDLVGDQLNGGLMLAVPEPTGLILFSLGCIVMLAGFRQRAARKSCRSSVRC